MSLTARALTILSTALILSAHRRRRQLAAVPRQPARASRADDPALPDTWSADRERRLEDRRARARVELADRVGRSRLRHRRRQDGGRRRSAPAGAFLRRTLGRRADVGPRHRLVHRRAPLGPVRHRLQDRQGPLAEHGPCRLCPKESKHQKNSYASETPVTDGERVYVYFGNAGLFAYDLNGKPVWSKPMGPFKVRSGWGHASSPVVHKDRVYIVNDNDDQSFIAAYDARTGAEVWKVNRDEGSNWTTPLVWENERAHGDRHRRHRQDPVLRSGRQAAVDA